MTPRTITLGVTEVMAVPLSRTLRAELEGEARRALVQARPATLGPGILARLLLLADEAAELRDLADADAALDEFAADEERRGVMAEGEVVRALEGDDHPTASGLHPLIEALAATTAALGELIAPEPTEDARAHAPHALRAGVMALARSWEAPR